MIIAWSEDDRCLFGGLIDYFSYSLFPVAKALNKFYSVFDMCNDEIDSNLKNYSIQLIISNNFFILIRVKVTTQNHSFEFVIMKIFQTIKMHLALSGCNKKNLSTFGTQQKWIFVEIFLSMTSLYVHLLCVAESPKEYMNSILLIAVGTLIIISRISTTLKMKTMFIFIEEVEEVLKSSEL